MPPTLTLALFLSVTSGTTLNAVQQSRLVPAGALLDEVGTLTFTSTPTQTPSQYVHLLLPNNNQVSAVNTRFTLSVALTHLLNCNLDTLEEIVLTFLYGEVEDNYHENHTHN